MSKILVFSLSAQIENFLIMNYTGFLVNEQGVGELRMNCINNMSYYYYIYYIIVFNQIICI